jgi:hypothetical protein
MPNYFFRIRKDDQTVGYVGVNLANIEAARKEAAGLIAEEPKLKPGRLWGDPGWKVQVTDERGLILFTIFSSAVESSAARG